MTLPPVLMPLRCRHPDCTRPEGGRCARAAEFQDPVADCPELLRAEEEALPGLSPPAATPPARPPAAPEIDDSAPWKGRRLDLQETAAILRRSPARLISVLGPYDAGKTSLMASFFLQIANRQYGTFPYRFASSRTLYGFQDLVARANRWTGEPGEQIVAHTPKEDSKETGRFLHLGLRPRDPKDDRHIDVLLSDIAGEWLESWGERVNEASRSRLSFVPRSDGVLVVADAAALLDTGGARMDGTIELLLRRVVSNMRPRRSRTGLALVFSKFDRVIDRVEPPDGEARVTRESWGGLGRSCPRIWSALKQARDAGLDVAIFAVSAFPRPLDKSQPVGVMAPFAHVMASADRREPWASLPCPVPEGVSGFRAMRRREGTP